MAHLDASSFGAGRGLSTRGESGEEIGRCANVHVDAVGFRRQQAIGEPGRHEDGRREAIFELTAPGLDDQRACGLAELERDLRIGAAGRDARGHPLQGGADRRSAGRLRAQAQELSTFLTWLSVRQHVSASTHYVGGHIR